MAVITYHTMISGCLQGNAESWKEFARQYSPYAVFILEHSFPELKPEVAWHVDRLFAQTREGEFFRAFQGRREREFLLHFRNFVGTYGRALTEAPETRVDRELLEKITEGFTLLQREIVWMSLKGIAAPIAHAILKVDGATASEVLKEANTNLKGLVERGSEACLAESGRGLLRAATGWSSKDCLEDSIYGKIVDGQISWRDRREVEHHLRSCFYCIDRFTSYKEAVYCLRKLPLAPEGDVERILRAVGIHPERKKKSLLSKLFAKSLQ